MKTVYHDGDGVIRPVVKDWKIVLVHSNGNVRICLGEYYGTWQQALDQAESEWVFSKGD